MEHLGQDIGQVEHWQCDQVQPGEGPGQEGNTSTPARHHLADAEWSTSVSGEGGLHPVPRY